MPPKKVIKDPVQRLRAEVARCKGRWMLLTEMSKGAFSYKWLIAFVNGKIGDPGFTKVIELGRLLGVKIEASSGPHALRPRG